MWNIPLSVDMFQYFSIFVRFYCTDKSVRMCQSICGNSDAYSVMGSVHEVFLTLKAKKK